jgi:hypothetical protein
MSERVLKCRIISFRVSDEEYATAEEASRKQGFSGVAVFARSATLACISSDPVYSPLDVEITRMWRRIEALTKALEELTAHVGVALSRSTWADLLVNSKLAPE